MEVGAYSSGDCLKKDRPGWKQLRGKSQLTWVYPKLNAPQLVAHSFGVWLKKGSIRLEIASRVDVSSNFTYFRLSRHNFVQDAPRLLVMKKS